MQRSVVLFAALALGATSAYGADIARFDTNGDNFASMSEVRDVFPGLTNADFRNLDTNRDRRLSAVEVSDAEAVRVFNKYRPHALIRDLDEIDLNGDRFASMDELEVAYPGFNAADFHLLDRNNDNRVSANELYRATSQATVRRYEPGMQILVSLDAIDTDRSGFADLAELNAQYPNLSSTEFHRIDTNSDNRLSFKELYTGDAISILGTNQ